MTAVHLRHEYDVDSQVLADIPFADLSSVIPTLNSWGIGDGAGADDYELAGQFVYSDQGAYFEVVISPVDPEVS